MKRPKTFEELLDPKEFRWPANGDRLLRRSDDWDKSVEFSQTPFARHVHIWSGYTRAASALVEEADQDSVDGHFLVYPILFNYRHALELALKFVIVAYGRYANVHLTEDEANHDLWSLWKLCKQVIVELGSEGEKDEALLAVEQVVKDFHDLDKSGMGFRYSTTKAGATIQLPTTPIDLRNIQDVMEGIDNFFSGVDGQLDANTSAMPWDEGDY